MPIEKHTEKIKCPDCGTIQDATVEHTVPFYTYLHICTKCDFTIMESDWEVVPTEKQLTAMQEHIAELTELKNKALAAIKLNGNRDMPTHIEDGLFAAYSNAIEQAKKKLATERQQLIDAVNNMSNVLIANDVMVSQINNINATPGENYYNETFKTQ